MKRLLTILLLCALSASGQNPMQMFRALNYTEPAPSVGGVWIRFKASSGVTLDGSGYVTGWADQSGSGRNATLQTGAGTGALYTANVGDGQPAVGNDGNNRGLIYNAEDLQAVGFNVRGITYFVVVKLSQDPNPTEAKTGAPVPVKSNANSHFPYTDGNIYEAFGTTTRKTVGNPATSMSGQFVTYCVVAYENDYRVYLNGSLIYSSTSNMVYMQPDLSLFVNATDGAYKFDGWVKDIAIFDTRLSDTDRVAFENELRTLYGHY